MERTVLFAGKEYPEGREFALVATRCNRNAIITVAEMPEDLEDGSMLRSAIAAFNENRTEQRLIDILEIYLIYLLHQKH